MESDHEKNNPDVPTVTPPIDYVARSGIVFSPIWPKEKVNDLIKCWFEKLSCSQIGKTLGFTRNAIIGKVHRLGLPPRKKPTAPRAEISSAREKHETREKRQRKSRKILPPHVGYSNSAAIALALKSIAVRCVKFQDLKRDECRFPIGEGPFTFCGLAKRKLSSYCDVHHEITHLPPIDR